MTRTLGQASRSSVETIAPWSSARVRASTAAARGNAVTASVLAAMLTV